MYRNILIATDGSKLAEMAVSHGVSLAKSTGAKVTALIVEASSISSMCLNLRYARCPKPSQSMPSM